MLNNIPTLTINIEGRKPYAINGPLTAKPQMTPVFSFFDQHNELSELLKLAIKTENPDKVKNLVTKKESNRQDNYKKTQTLIDQKITVDKIVQTDYLVKSYYRSKKINKIAIKKFRSTKQDQQTDQKTIENTPVLDNNPTELSNTHKTTFNIDIDHFDSGLENSDNNDIENIEQKPKLSFINPSLLQRSDKTLHSSSDRIVQISSFIHKAIRGDKDQKVYTCKFCAMVFNKRAALGGHISKNHPRQSEEYRKRVESANNRRIERERVDYFRTIKGELD